jgi:pimeloyl-ACP methyl ester carboxylesterase
LVLLVKAGIEPPYILLGDSFGSYNVRLYAHLFPQKVVGIVLTDGLHETAMLKMPILLQALKLFFISGFGMSILGSTFGIIRLLKVLGAFELLKPELRNFSQNSLNWVKRSFCRPKHWITMSREMINLDKSARQVSIAKYFDTLPIVSIKASLFFKPSFWTFFIPLKNANQLREKMHVELCNLSADFLQVEASKSSHFVWVDQPDVIVDAVKVLLNKMQ